MTTVSDRDVISLPGAAPVLGRVLRSGHGGPEGLIFRVEMKGGHPPPMCTPFALRVEADSFAPRARHGEHLLVDPSAVTGPDDDVYILLSDGRGAIAKLCWQERGEVGLDGSLSGRSIPWAVRESSVMVLSRVIGVLARPAKGALTDGSRKGAVK